MSQAPPANPHPFRGKLTHNTLLVLLPLALIPVLLSGIITLYLTNNFLRYQLDNQISNVADAQVKEIESLISAKSAFLKGLLADQSFLFAVQEALKQTPASSEWETSRLTLLDIYSKKVSSPDYSYPNDLLVVLPNGTILISTNPQWEGLTMENGSAYSSLLTEASATVRYHSSPFYENQFLVFVSQPVVDSSDRLTAILVGIDESDRFGSILSLGNLPYPTGRAYLITDPETDGAFIGLAPNNGNIEAYTPSSDQNQVLTPRLTDDNRNGLLDFNSFDGEPVIAAIRWIDVLSAALIIEVPQTVIVEPITSLAIANAAIFLIALLVLGVAIWRGAARVTRPILQIAATTQAFADGNLQARAPVERNDEIGLLAHTFNQVADQHVGMYQSLEALVESRTRQIRTAAEVASIATSEPSVEKLLQRTVNLIIERFGYYHAGIYILDNEAKFATLQQSCGRVPQESLAPGYRIPVSSRSIIGWVSSRNQPWIAADTSEDPYYLPVEQLPQTKSEAGIPLSVGKSILGVLDVQSDRLNAFGNEEIDTLQTLANQIASALQNIRLLEATQSDLRVTSLLYQASHTISEATTADEVFQRLADILHQIPFASALFSVSPDGLKSIHFIDAQGQTMPLSPAFIPLPIDEITSFLLDYTTTPIAVDSPPVFLPVKFQTTAARLGCSYYLVMPMLPGQNLEGLLIVGATSRADLNPAAIETIDSLIDITTSALEKTFAIRVTTEQLAELQTLNTISQAISTETDLYSLMSVIHRQVLQVIGNVNFLVALYDPVAQTIEIPYMDEGGRITSIAPFPMGQGLTSILIRTRQPLMIVEDTVNRTRALGAIVTGDRPAKSWLGVPLLLGGEVLGAIIVQDLDQEFRFDENDMRLLTTLAGQLAATIRNIRLLADTQQAADRDRLLYEITSKIRRSTNIQDILQTTARELGKAFNARRANIAISINPIEVKPGGNGNEEKLE